MRRSRLELVVVGAKRNCEVGIRAIEDRRYIILRIGVGGRAEILEELSVVVRRTGTVGTVISSAAILVRFKSVACTGAGQGGAVVIGADSQLFRAIGKDTGYARRASAMHQRCGTLRRRGDGEREVEATNERDIIGGEIEGFLESKLCEGNRQGITITYTKETVRASTVSIITDQGVVAGIATASASPEASSPVRSNYNRAGAIGAESKGCEEWCCRHILQRTRNCIDGWPNNEGASIHQIEIRHSSS